MIRLIAHSKYLVTVGVLEAGEGESAPIQHLPKVGGCSQSLRCTHIREQFLCFQKKVEQVGLVKLRGGLCSKHTAYYPQLLCAVE